MESLTVRQKPFPGESITSYLFRLKDGNGAAGLRIFNLFTSRNKHIQSTDLLTLDIFPKSFIDVDKLSIATGCSNDLLLKTTFFPVLKTFRVDDEIEHSRFISGMLSNEYRFCPYCLKEKSYYRLLWRIADISICADHGCKLLNSCGACGKHILLSNMYKTHLFEYLCPFCNSYLCNSKASPANANELKKNKWTMKAWTSLLTSPICIDSKELAIRLLYVIGNFESAFYRESFSSSIPNKILLASLLQHARGSLSQDRTLHLSFVLQTLYQHGVSIEEFLKLEIPQSFRTSLQYNFGRKVERFMCQAPWCQGYQVPGSLIKTGTSVKKMNTGEKLSYYMACQKCGCEYAIQDSGQIVERTYFIEGYRKLSTISGRGSSIKALAREINITEEKIRRLLAYFNNQNLFQGFYQALQPNGKLLTAVIAAIKNGVTIKEIQSWECWKNDFHFLVYRFHPLTMRALLTLKRPRFNKRENDNKYVHQVREILEKMLDGDKNISISAVSRQLNVVPETLRHWGCNTYIAQMKEIQMKQRLENFKMRVYRQVDVYLQNRLDQIITSNELYNHLGVKRTVLWRNAPELTAYITDRLRGHNQSFNNETI